LFGLFGLSLKGGVGIGGIVRVSRACRCAGCPFSLNFYDGKGKIIWKVKAINLFF